MDKPSLGDTVIVNHNGTNLAAIVTGVPDDGGSSILALSALRPGSGEILPMQEVRHAEDPLCGSNGWMSREEHARLIASNKKKSEPAKSEPAKPDPTYRAAPVAVAPTTDPTTAAKKPEPLPPVPSASGSTRNGG